MPKAGYGQSRRLADALNVHTTLVSHVMKGKKAFSLEQAIGTCEFLSLSDTETEFFLILVQAERAGNMALRKHFSRQMEKLREHSKELVNRLSSKRKLTEEDRATFYSDWAYSAVRQLIAIKGYQKIEDIAEYFRLSRRRTKEIIDFLVRVQLCIEDKSGLKVGPATTHLESSSPWVRSHHVNWRQKSVESLNREDASKLHYTAPMTLSRNDAEVIREMIVKFLESVDPVVEPSPSEALYCLNIDWFEV
jgi:uncharacterized protein (TIGR02147 family)